MRPVSLPDEADVRVPAAVGGRRGKSLLLAQDHCLTPDLAHIDGDAVIDLVDEDHPGA